MLSETTRSDAVLKRLLALHPKKIDLALDRILRLLLALGNPQLRLPPVIHVAGTNGKGSVCAFARAMLEAQGLKAHVHISPHLVRFHERIRIAGKLISEEALVSLLEEVEEVNAGREITFFEITAAAMFLAFSRHPADATIATRKEPMISTMDIPERIGKIINWRFSFNTFKLFIESVQPFESLVKMLIMIWVVG